MPQFDQKDVAVVNNWDVGVRPKSASREMQAIIADLEVKGGINQQQFQLKLWWLNPLNNFAVLSKSVWSCEEDQNLRAVKTTAMV